MRYGVVILPESPWSSAQATWQRAEELGFDHAWTYDHLAWRTMRDEAWFGAIPVLTAAACATSRIRLGTLVASPNFRHPVPFAKELMTLDDISGGRATLGIGSGGTGWDATILGGPPWPAAERAERFDEFVAMADRLLRDRRLTYEGRWYQADGARAYPGCVQQPRLPFAIAATGPKGMRLAAAHGQTWISLGDPARPTPQGPGLVKEQMQRLDDACLAIGRDPTTIDRLVLAGGPLLDSGLDSVDAFRDTAGGYEAIGVTDFVVHWPRPTEPFAADYDTFEEIANSISG